MNKEQLVQFEKGIADLFLDKRIRYPVHLSGGNEEILIEVFKRVREGDWVFSTHRNHYHALLGGFTEEELRKWIMKNGSMHVYRERFFTSGIVGGVLPIAVGVSLGIKIRGGSERVWCFVGDMGGETGIFHESVKYAKNFHLPIRFIVESNGYSVDTPTREVWGYGKPNGIGIVKRYSYKREYPHVGCGEWVTF